MQEALSQVVLPIVLAFIMFAMGLGLRLVHFREILRSPQAMLLGFGAQMVFLPSLALILIIALGLDGPVAAGLFLLSLCPGGATSNLFSYLAGGNVALSIALTAVTSLLVPFTLPLMFVSYLNASGDTLAAFDFPLALTIKQLLVVTAVPVVVGMAIRHWATSLANRIEQPCKRLSTIVMMLLVLALMGTHLPIMADLFSMKGLAVMLLSVFAFVSGLTMARQFGCSSADSRTIAVEVGIQNAGTAILVAMAFLQRPELAMIPLMYGILMNIPGFAFIALLRYRDGRSLLGPS
ncbi:bile acid:sodium symporter family protein [Oceanobacter kriegii]|uniref:bile acid:sodium symporter family protein n=1 Tax=Oceanobacter kriegii TaxID=64972 RepID=UPI000427A4E5|nr:bile acid:sodium symporter family protein [Oceanobacter kriegii]